MTEITAGVAIRHKKRPDMQGRVRHLVGERAVVTWVRRRNLSCVRVANLEPIEEAALARYFHEREAEDTRTWKGRAGESTNAENRRFLLGEEAPVTELRARCWPELGAPMGCES